MSSGEGTLGRAGSRRGQAHSRLRSLACLSVAAKICTALLLPSHRRQAHTIPAFVHGVSRWRFCLLAAPVLPRAFSGACAPAAAGGVRLCAPSSCAACRCHIIKRQYTVLHSEGRYSRRRREGRNTRKKTAPHNNSAASGRMGDGGGGGAKQKTWGGEGKGKPGSGRTTKFQWDGCRWGKQAASIHASLGQQRSCAPRRLPAARGAEQGRSGLLGPGQAGSNSRSLQAHTVSLCETAEAPPSPCMPASRICTMLPAMTTMRPAAAALARASEPLEPGRSLSTCRTLQGDGGWGAWVGGWVMVVRGMVVGSVGVYCSCCEDLVGCLPWASRRRSQEQVWHAVLLCQAVHSRQTK